MPSPVKNSLLFLFALALACLIAEVYLRFNPPDWLPAQTFISIQQEGSEFFPDPRIGYVPRAGDERIFRGREFKTRVKINSAHMRDREYPVEKNADKKRIIAVGDSYVFGWGVEQDQAFTEILEDRLLKNTEVLNMGVSGYCGSQEVEWLAAQGVKYQPDVVLFFTCGFPVSCISNNIFKNGQMVWVSESSPGPWARFRAWAYRRSYLFNFLYFFYSRSREILVSAFGRGARPAGPLKFISSDDRPEYLSEGQSILEKLDSLSRKNGFKPILVFFHERHEAEDGLPEIEREDAAYLENFCRQRGWGFLDLTEILRIKKLESGLSSYFKYDVHWNRHGHEAVAAALADYLTANGFAEPRRES